MSERIVGFFLKSRVKSARLQLTLTLSTCPLQLRSLIVGIAEIYASTRQNVSVDSPRCLNQEGFQHFCQKFIFLGLVINL
jgi:hypothetical protein